MKSEDPSQGAPVIVAFPSPFRLVMKDSGDVWKAELKDINHLTYDCAKLSRASAFFDGNIAPLAMMAGYDGSLAMPALAEYRDPQKAAAIFNRTLAELLLGGVYAEAVAPAELAMGSLLPTGYVRLFAGGIGVASDLHSALRTRSPSPTQAMALLRPAAILADDFVSAVQRGKEVLKWAPTLSPDILLSGITHLVRRQLIEALVALWTSVEQIVSHVWEVKVRAPAGAEARLPRRKDFLADNRTWPIAARIEVLFQKSLISASLYGQLDSARKARNEFIHAGAPPSDASVASALAGLMALLSLCQTNFASEDALQGALDMAISRAHARGPEESRDSQPEFWRAIPPLPGEVNWTGDFEPFELDFQPISEIHANSARNKSSAAAAKQARLNDEGSQSKLRATKGNRDGR